MYSQATKVTGHMHRNTICNIKAMPFYVHCFFYRQDTSRRMKSQISAFYKNSSPQTLASLIELSLANMYVRIIEK